MNPPTNEKKIQIIQVPCSKLTTAYRIQFLLLFLRSRPFNIPIHWFIQWIFIEYLPHSRHCSGHVGHISEQNLTNTPAVSYQTMKETQARLLSNPQTLSQLSTFAWVLFLYTINTSFPLNGSLAYVQFLELSSSSIFSSKIPFSFLPQLTLPSPWPFLSRLFDKSSPYSKSTRREKNLCYLPHINCIIWTLKTTLLGGYYVYFRDNNTNNGNNNHFLSHIPALTKELSIYWLM